MDCNESIHSLGSMKDGDDTFLESVKTSVYSQLRAL